MQQARAAFANNRMDLARNLCEQIVVRTPNHPDAVFVRGQIAFAQNRLDEAASHMLRSADLQPNNPAVRIGLGKIRTFQGRYHEAVTDDDVALLLEPNNAPAIAGQADAYEKSGHATRPARCSAVRRAGTGRPVPGRRAGPSRSARPDLRRGH